LDTEEIVKTTWQLFQHDGAAAFKLSERSPFPPALCSKDLSEEQTQVLNILQIKSINCHPVASHEDSSSESISDAENWLN